MITMVYYVIILKGYVVEKFRDIAIRLGELAYLYTTIEEFEENEPDALAEVKAWQLCEEMKIRILTPHLRVCGKCSLLKEEAEFPSKNFQLPMHCKVSCKMCQSPARRVQPSQQTRYGYIYIIKNAAWPDWCKIGLTTTSPEHRLSSYQTGAPFRDYYVRFSKESSDVTVDEASVHKALIGLNYESNSEWLKIPCTDAISIINRIVR